MIIFPSNFDFFLFSRQKSHKTDRISLALLFYDEKLDAAPHARLIHRSPHIPLVPVHGEKDLTVSPHETERTRNSSHQREKDKAISQRDTGTLAISARSSGRSVYSLPRYFWEDRANLSTKQAQ